MHGKDTSLCLWSEGSCENKRMFVFKLNNSGTKWYKRLHLESIVSHFICVILRPDTEQVCSENRDDIAAQCEDEGECQSMSTM